ncbi:MAG: hypothetical protein A2Y25_07355 [Candidatus Melainabacteria bacterium GWF2_37_15]|nr:MAG: hypothetical protein A2Y25_07355 [Candidatus Melainabacteria bacterium GWF2_37_15]
MRTKAVRKSNMSNERVLALDELLPKRATQYDCSPGVYVRSDKERELDILWQGYRINSKEEKSPFVYLCVGFVAGIIIMIIMTAILNFGNPSRDNLAELNLWEKASIKSANPVVNVTPSAENNGSVLTTTAEYKVQSGDTLERIAYKFYGNGSPSKVNKIQSANNMDSPHKLKIGQKLIIPVED